MNHKKINSDIRSSRVRVIDYNGNQLGVLPTNIAIVKAQNRGYDLVEVSNKSVPPVCKIMDYGKYQFEQKKHDRKNKSKNKVHSKEIRMKTCIADHDLTTKLKKCVDFLNKNYKVKVSIQIHFRRKNNEQVGLDLMDNIISILSDFGNVSNKPKLDGKYINAFFTPK